MKFRIALAAMALLVLGMNGVASAQPPTGNLVFVHGIPGGPAVDLVIYPNDGDIALPDIPVAPGTTTPAIPLPVETHGFEVYVGEDLIGGDIFTIAAGATTTITATLDDGKVALTIGDPVPDPVPTPTPTVSASPTASASPAATPRPQTVTVPTRVETGAGGSATDAAPELVLGGLAVAVAAGALTLGLRRRTTA